MNRNIAEALLARELAGVKQMGYQRLAGYVDGEPITKEVVAADGKRYQLETNIFWDDREHGPIRIISSASDGSFWRSMLPLSVGALVHPPEAAAS